MSEADVRELMEKAKKAQERREGLAYIPECDVIELCEDWLRMRERLNAILSRSRWATWNSHAEKLEPRFSEEEFLELTQLAGIDQAKCELTQDQED